MYRQTFFALALAIAVVGCGSSDSERVPLVTVDSEAGGGCWLLHQTVDVIADPATGTPALPGGASLRWPRGYTAWRAGTEVSVLDEAGRVVLTTGGRYELCPTPNTDYSRPVSDWVIGGARPCPDCPLGWGVD